MPVLQTEPENPNMFTYPSEAQILHATAAALIDKVSSDPDNPNEIKIDPESYLEIHPAHFQDGAGLPLSIAIQLDGDLSMPSKHCTASLSSNVSTDNSPTDSLARKEQFEAEWLAIVSRMVKEVLAAGDKKLATETSTGEGNTRGENHVCMAPLG